MRKLVATLVAVFAVMGGSASASTAHARKAGSSYYAQAKRAVCFYFGRNCDLAMKIVKCETGGTYYPWSANGQYKGIFQMGSHERATYGDGNNVWAQAKAAHRYFMDSGFSPWLKWEPPGCAS